MSRRASFLVFLCCLLLWTATAHAADGLFDDPRRSADELFGEPERSADLVLDAPEQPDGAIREKTQTSAKSGWTAEGVFGKPERPAGDNDPWHRKIQPLWQRVLKEEKVSPGFTANAENFGPVDAPTWRNLVALAPKSPALEKLRLVNGYFNQWRPKKDADTWDSPEYWAAPKEFIRLRGGDCEDYAIAKYFALRFLNVAADNMRVAIVRRKDENGAYAKELHAILAVRANDTWFILDNNARPRNNIFPHTQYKGRFDPIYSVNENGAWIHGNQAGTVITTKN